MQNIASKGVLSRWVQSPENMMQHEVKCIMESKQPQQRQAKTAADIMSCSCDANHGFCVCGRGALNADLTY